MSVKSSQRPAMPADVYEAFKKDFQNGIITLGDVCDANCLFCSQKWNPPDIAKRLNRLLTLEEIRHFLDRYLEKPQLIGSAFHVNSGEFFLHRDATRILRILQKKYGKALKNVIIFSNGLPVTEEHIRLVKEMDLYFILSLHMVTPERRKQVLGGTTAGNKNAVHVVRLLNQYKVNHSVSVVPMKSNILNGEFENTLRFIAEQGTKSIQIHRPGYTRYTPPEVIKELVLPAKAFSEVIKRHRQQYGTDLNLSRHTNVAKAKHIYQVLWELLQREKRLIKARKLFLYSESVQEVFPSVLKKLPMRDYASQMVKSGVLGGNVQIAGLLFVEDYMKAIEKFLQAHPDFRPEAMILPRISFDVNLEDLSMVPAQKLEDRFGVKLYFAGDMEMAFYVGEH